MMRPVISTITLGVAALMGAQQIPTIRVPVRLVAIPTLVFSNQSRLLYGLETADFRVLDNGRPQSVDLATSYAPVSVALAIQVNRDVRQYVPFIARTGSTVDALLVGETGEAAVLTYASEVTVVKPFGKTSVQSTVKSLSASGRQARMIDAGMQAVALLATRPRSRDRVLLFVGQPVDSGSESALATLREAAEKANVAVYALALPEWGKEFVSDTFSLQGATFEERGGFHAGVDLGKLVSVLNRNTAVVLSADPFSILTAATGGTQFHFRQQRQFEDGIAAIGVQLRSSYILTYYPSTADPGFHTVKVEVDIPNAKVYSRSAACW